MRSVLFFVPKWPERSGSAAGARTDRLLRAFSEWGFRVTVACATPRNEVATQIEQECGAATIELPLNCAAALRETLASTEPDVTVFDRFYIEEALSHGIRKLRPAVLRVLDMQDSHALRLARQRCVLNESGSIAASLATWPLAGDATLARELGAIHRSDVTLACSPVELRWLRDICGVPAFKLALAPLFHHGADALSDSASGSAPHPPFSERAGFVALGTWKHLPNVDATRWLATDVWPNIKAQLPQATLTVAGSHPTREARAMHSPRDGVTIMGDATDAQLARTLAGARVLIAPLRFGAGLKGKVLEAWSHGTPVATTPIGAEGMSEEAMRGVESGLIAAEGHTTHCPEETTAATTARWGGLCSATDADALVADALRLHEDQQLWEACSREAIRLCSRLFDEVPRMKALRMTVESSLASLRARRAADYHAATMWHHSQRSTEYLAKWIEMKESIKAARAAEGIKVE